MSHKVIVEAIGTKPVTTKFGEKSTYSFKGNDGQWYKLGFKKPQFAKGDEVEFEFTSGKWGNEVTSVLSAPTADADAPVVATTAPAPRKAYGGGTAGGGYSRGTFPIPPTDGQRSIIRQNSLSNSIKFFEANAMKPSIDEVLRLAKTFEAYSAGDDIAAAAKKALKDEANES